MSGCNLGKLVMSVDIGRIRTKLYCLHFCTFISRVWMHCLLEKCLVEQVCRKITKKIQFDQPLLCLSWELLDKVLLNHFWCFIPFQNIYLFIFLWNPVYTAPILSHSE